MHKNNHSIILLRGLPGSGKSTIAKLLSEDKYPVYSVDDYFTDDKGNYKFNHLDNHLAYQKCESSAENAMKNGVSKIFIDNTFTIDWEMKPYFHLAERYNYTIYVITVENYHGKKNLHGIPDEQVEKMRLKFKVRL